MASTARACAVRNWGRVRSPSSPGSATAAVVAGGDGGRTAGGRSNLRAPMRVVRRNNVTLRGRPSGPPMVFAHGFGCDQNMWRFVVPAFEDEYRVVLFDHVGAGGSELAAYDEQKYSSLDGYAGDVLELCAELELEDVVFVGHSVSGMIGVLAATRQPERFAKLVLVSPSPRYLDDDGYVGGFRLADIEELLESLDSNYLGWSRAMAPVIMGNADRPE